MQARQNILAEVSQLPLYLMGLLVIDVGPNQKNTIGQCICKGLKPRHGCDLPHIDGKWRVN
jgi:hypothetical protein